MERWQHPFLGLTHVPATLTAFEIDRFFTLTAHEHAQVRQTHTPLHRLAIALQVGFLRMTGRVLNNVKLIPRPVLAHLGQQLGIDVPTLASIRSLYRRKRTLFEHQTRAADMLAFRILPDKARPWLVKFLRGEAQDLLSTDQLIVATRVWFYQHRYFIPNERVIQDLARECLVLTEDEVLAQIETEIPAPRRQQWLAELLSAHPHVPGLSVLEWFQESPKKLGPRNLAEAFEKLQRLIAMEIPHYRLSNVSMERLQAYAQHMIRRRPVRFSQLKEPRRTLELVCFLRFTLLQWTDVVLQQVERQIADLWRDAYDKAMRSEVLAASQYRSIVVEIEQLLVDPHLDADTFREQIRLLVIHRCPRAYPSRRAAIRYHLLSAGPAMHTLMAALTQLPFQASDTHPLLPALDRLRELYAKHITELPGDIICSFAPSWEIWVNGTDRRAARTAYTAATLLYLRRSLRNGSTWIDHSLSYRSRDAMLIAPEIWQENRTRHYQRLKLPLSADLYLKPILANLRVGLQGLSEAVAAGEVTIDKDGIHIPAIKAVALPIDVESIRQQIKAGIPTIEFPELMLEIDSHTRFSWQLLNRAPRTEVELIELYCAVMALGMGLDASDLQRMVSGFRVEQIRRQMQELEATDRLRQANTAVLQFMRRHPIVQQWGVEGLASSDMMSLDASKELWTARVDPRRRTHAVGTYTHVLDQYGIVYDQPIVLNKRQAGAAIEGAIRQDLVTLERVAVDTHGYTDFAMLMAKLLGFDLCPRLASLDERKLFVPRSVPIPENLRSVAVPLSIRSIAAGWDGLIRVAASIQGGWCSAVLALDRFGSDAKGDPIHKSGSCMGKLIRTLYLCDVLAHYDFRRMLYRALAVGESSHELQRAICPNAMAPKRGRRPGEHGATSGALTLLTNLVMAWNTQYLQQRVSAADASQKPLLNAAMAHVSAALFSHINFKGRFDFPMARYRARLIGEDVSRATLATGEMR